MVRTIKLSLALSLIFGAIGCAKTTAPAPQPPPAFTSPTPEQMDAAFKKASTTTAEHELLKGAVGKWTATTTMWMEPNGKPQVSKGTSVVTSLFDGKFIKEDFTGMFMGQKLKGIGITGFDTVNSELNTMWIDSMGTMMMVMNGTINLEQKVLSMSGAMSRPMVNGKMRVRAETIIKDKNHRSFAMFHAGPDGKEFKGFEISYVRAGTK